MFSNPPAATDGVPYGSNNASPGQSAPQSLAGDTMIDDTMYIPGGKYNYDGSKKYPDGYPDDIYDTDADGNYKYDKGDPVGALPYRYERGDIESQVKGMYKDLLGREADAEGLKYWTDEIQNNPDNIETNWVGPRQFKGAIQNTIDNIMRSDEYQNRKGRTSPPDERAPKPPTPIVRPLPQPPAPPIGDPGPREPEIRRPKPPGPGRPDEIIPIMPTPGPSPEIGLPYFPPGVEPPVAPKPPVSPKVDDWLQKAYTQAGLGKVDAGGRDYWTGDLEGGQTKEQVIANIMRHKK